MAPITPFLTEYVWAALRGPGDPESVHLADWPAADPALVDAALSGQMALTRRLVELGRSARSAASIPVRQPLARAVVSAAGFADLAAELRDEVARELNVHQLQPMAAVGDDLVEHVVKPNFRTLGRRFGKGTQAVAAAIGAADPEQLAAELTSAGKVSVEVDGAPVALGPDDVIVTQTPRSGWTVATEARRDGRHRGGHHPGAAPRRAGPGGHPAGAGRAQERRAARQRPDHGALGNREPGAGHGPGRARRTDRQRGAGR